MELLNWGLIKHPLNWVTLFLMVLIFVIAAHFVLAWIQAPKKQPSS